MIRALRKDAMKPIDEIRLIRPDTLLIDGQHYRCTIGRGGIRGDKREGDLATPRGSFPLRQCFWRPDRMKAPQTQLPLVALTPEDGWCDDPAHPAYNTAVKLPFAASHEKLWRDDHVYDLIIPMGYNDGPIVPGKGSAIFMHCMRPDRVGTEGCIALQKDELLALLPRFLPATMVIVP